MADGGCQNWVEAADGRQRMSDGGIDGGKYCRRRPPSSVVKDVFNCSGAPSSSDHGRHPRGLAIALQCNPDGDGDEDEDDDDDDDDDEDEDDDDRSCQDRATGVWALCRGTSMITTTLIRRRSQAGLRRRRRHQRRREGGQNDGGPT